MPASYYSNLCPARPAAHPGCVDALLRAGSSPTKACDGNPPLCLAACLPLGPGPQRTEAGHAIARLLLERGVDPHDRCEAAWPVSHKEGSLGVQWPAVWRLGWTGVRQVHAGAGVNLP